MDERDKLPIPLLLSVAIAVAIAGCGGTRHSSTSTAAPTTAKALPAGWSTVRTASGASLPYPPGFKPISGDPGSASAALFNSDGTIRAYLNATPADSKEQPATWAHFRVNHNADEGDRHVRMITSVRNAAVGSEHGPCVLDQYQTSRTNYRELACLVAPADGGPRTVLVAAAQPAAWASQHRSLEFAINHFSN
jgi:hypothetical protein